MSIALTIHHAIDRVDEWNVLMYYQSIDSVCVTETKLQEPPDFGKDTGAVARRQFLIKIAFGIGVASTLPYRRCCQMTPIEQLLAGAAPFDALEAIRRLAGELTRDEHGDEDHYVQVAEALLVQAALGMRFESLPSRHGGWNGKFVLQAPPISLLQIDMLPNSQIPLHDHRHLNGVLLNLQGVASVRRFDICSDLPSSDPSVFAIQELPSQKLLPGRCSALTTAAANIHEIRTAESGCRMLDLFTAFNSEARSHNIEWTGVPYDSANSRFWARWQ